MYRMGIMTFDEWVAVNGKCAGRFLARSRWFLLADAVEAAQAPDEFGGVDPHDAMLGKLALENVQRAAVIGVAVGRHADQTVGEVEVVDIEIKPEF